MRKTLKADHVKLKRAYEHAAAGDGTRILIDRLWPRGVKKADAAIDQWDKDIAPSTALRKWFVRAHPEQLDRLRALARQGPITLVYSAHDEVHNDAVALRGLLLGSQTSRRRKLA
jgi:uncharacterized protein YeaO (DUF488 family)